jgi:hypothetical protein
MARKRKKPNRPYQIFLSHSGEDTWVAGQLKRSFEACGADVFLDEAEIDVGADFEEDILQSLESANELVVLLTPWALDRPYVWAELGAAFFRRIQIVGILYGITTAELQARPSTPVLLKKRNLIRLTPEDMQKYLKQLERRCK